MNTPIALKQIEHVNIYLHEPTYAYLVESSYVAKTLNRTKISLYLRPDAN